MAIIGNGLVILGIITLTVALLLVRGLFLQLPAGPVRSQWKLLTILIVIFIAGYIGYTLLHWNRSTEFSDLIVPAIFICGAIFVFMVCSLSLKTARDLVKIFTLQHESITDPLLGIYNRRHLDRQLEKEIVRAKRHDLPLSVLLTDIDNFKEINDDYGHQAGDIVLKEVSQTLLSEIRETDIIARYGGDEFLAILPNTSCANAYEMAERIRKKIADLRIHFSNKIAGEQPAMRVTISGGVACLSYAVQDEQTLMNHADIALYHAKERGRNIIVTDEAREIN